MYDLHTLAQHDRRVRLNFSGLIQQLLEQLLERLLEAQWQRARQGQQKQPAILGALSTLSLSELLAALLGAQPDGALVLVQQVEDILATALKKGTTKAILLQAHTGVQQALVLELQEALQRAGLCWGPLAEGDGSALAQADAATPVSAACGVASTAMCAAALRCARASHNLASVSGDGRAPETNLSTSAQRANEMPKVNHIGNK